jgi:threonine aldolase
MYSFKNDYSEGCHPTILQALLESNLIQETGYGEDNFCLEAIKLIQNKIENPNTEIHFVSGGTQANIIVISSILKPYESVISAISGHIAIHETGAIEATGHKINTIETPDGKLTPKQIQEVVTTHTDEHMVKPKLVYISNSTETGTIYNKSELTAISEYCRQNNLYLFLDGARLGSALTAKKNDLTLPDIARLVDAFYIGGTKNGALLGEAIILINNDFKPNFRHNIKQKGGLLAKGKLLGIQFLELFRDNLFFELGQHANKMAEKLATGLQNTGHEFLTEPASNQIFPILSNQEIEKLSIKYGFYVWQKIDQSHSVIRLVTSWATDEKMVDQFINDLK